MGFSYLNIFLIFTVSRMNSFLSTSDWHKKKTLQLIEVTSFFLRTCYHTIMPKEQ